jgi:5-methylcytosine-specific restriction endonuclease McrA
MGKMITDIKDLCKEYNKVVSDKKVSLSTWKTRNKLSIAISIHYGKRPRNLNEITPENNIITMWITPSDRNNPNVKTNKYNKLNNKQSNRLRLRWLCFVRDNFKCVYCNKNLKEKNWHLDHFQALSTGGNNSLENLVSSCARCNIMKGNLDGYGFYKKCQEIVNNSLFKMYGSNNL